MHQRTTTDGDGTRVKGGRRRKRKLEDIGEDERWRSSFTVDINIIAKRNRAKRDYFRNSMKTPKILFHDQAYIADALTVIPR